MLIERSGYEEGSSTIHVFDVHSGEKIATFGPFINGVTGAAISPKGAMVAAYVKILASKSTGIQKNENEVVEPSGLDRLN
jgi:hypothetical protein